MEDDRQKEIQTSETAKEIASQDVSEIFNNAVIVCLSRHKWGNVKKIPKEVLEQMTDGKIKEMVRATKDLIAKEALEDYNTYYNKCGALIRDYATTIPSLDGMYLVRKDRALDLAKKLDEMIVNADFAADQIAEKYSEYRAAARPILEEQGLFNDQDYPADIRAKFGISYRFLTIGVSDAIKTFDAQFYTQEEQKLSNMFAEARAEAILFWRDALQKLLDDTVDILKGEKKIIRQDRIDKFAELENVFKSGKICNDPDLEKLLKMTTDLMKGVDAGHLRDSNVAKQEKAVKLDQIKEVLKANTETLKRTISLPKKKSV